MVLFPLSTDIPFERQTSLHDLPTSPCTGTSAFNGGHGLWWQISCKQNQLIIGTVMLVVHWVSQHQNALWKECNGCPYFRTLTERITTYGTRQTLTRSKVYLVTFVLVVFLHLPIHPFNKSTICRFPLMTSNSCFQILFRNVQRPKTFPISFLVWSLCTFLNKF